MSDTFSVTWSPGTAVLYQQAGNQKYFQVDADTGREQPLVPRNTSGWMFSPASAPDGRRVAVWWNRPPDRGIFVINAADHQETLVHRSDTAWMAPIGWSADGRSIYAIEGKTLTTARGLTPPLGETLTEAKIVRIPLTGTPETIAALPARETGGITMTADARKFVYTVYSSRSDVWIVDNFDAAPPMRLSRAAGK